MNSHINRKTVAILIIIALLLTFANGLAPTSKMETTINRIDEANQRVFYNIPLSGGGVASCSAENDVLKNLTSSSSILIEESALFGGCKATLPHWPIDVELFVKSALLRTQPGYKSIDELRKNYPGFNPKIRLWGDDPWYMPQRFRRYSVQMPEELVIFDPDGNVLTTRRCGSEGGYCEAVLPAYPERGIVGTVQYGAPDYLIATDFKISWPDDSNATLFKSGNCFSAHSLSKNNGEIIIHPKGGSPMHLQTGYGFYLVAGLGDGFSILKISKEIFDMSRSCSKEAMATWPNAGGYAWKRQAENQ